MKHIVIGTAGHIDHGKTALVKALTGIDADRLEEEKRRGITIDLGFAHLQLTPSLQAAFVDVPGHERFVRNMLAGVGGIDLVLFVVAADESIKPQTREHFEICRLLGIREGVIALTKSDLAGPETVALVRMEVEDLVAGSFLAGAPIIPVSAVTGAGISNLKTALTAAGENAASRDFSGWFRMPVDRSFTMRGFGAVVTGTLISGSIAKEAEIQVYPSGRTVRVRGIQVHGSASTSAVAGQRVALNLAGMDSSDLRRGDVLAGAGVFRPVQVLDCRLELLRSAKPLKNRAPIHFHSGAAETEAEVRLLGGGPEAGNAIQPGESRWVRILLREPVLILPGDRFIVRMFSPVTTIGGGVVVDISGRRYRKGDDVASRLARLHSGGAGERIAQIVSEAAYGTSVAELIALTGLHSKAIVESAAGAGLVSLVPNWYVNPHWLETKRAAAIDLVTAWHAANPLAPGMPRSELAGALFPGAPAFLFEALLNATQQLAAEGDVVRLQGRRITLEDSERKAREEIEAAFQKSGLATPPVSEVLANSGLEPARAKALLALLLRERTLVRIGDDLVFHSAAIANLRAMLAARKGARLSVPEFKNLTGVSRKYAIPLLEYLDRERVTRREGSERVVI